jgi:hypothetical protein
MTPASDLADLSSVRSQLDEMTNRVTGIASRYQATPDSSVAIDLFEAERALRSAGRVLERAISALEELST